MTFGRMSNMRRRAHRPDESFHRDRRRRRVTRPLRGSAATFQLARLLRRLMALIIRK